MLNIRFNDRHSGAVADRLAAGGAGAARRRGSTSTSPSAARASSPRPAPAVERAAGGGRGGHRAGAEARHRRRHLGCALHRAVLPGGGVRAGRPHHAPGGRARAGCRIARRWRGSIAPCSRRSCHEPPAEPARRSRAAGASCGWPCCGAEGIGQFGDTPAGVPQQPGAAGGLPAGRRPCSACCRARRGGAGGAARRAGGAAGAAGAVGCAGAAVGARARVAALCHRLQLVRAGRCCGVRPGAAG